MHLEHLADGEDRRRRLEQLKLAIGRTDEATMASYAAETAEWERSELSDAS